MEESTGHRSLSSESLESVCAALAQLSGDCRVTVRRSGPPKRSGACVVYWMQRAQRGKSNPALDCAVHVANQLGLPLLVYLSAIPNYPNANLRHYAFLNQGFADIDQELAQRNIAFALRRSPGNPLEALLEEVNASIVIGDENHCREPERWRRVLATRLRIPFWTVDADLIVPSKLFPKAQYAAYTLRPRLYSELPRYLCPSQNSNAHYTWKRPPGFESYPVSSDITQGWTRLDRSVRPVEGFSGGSFAARKRLRLFLQQILPNYETLRNRPEQDGTSRLSPYLHFGHISPLEIALAVNAEVKKNPLLAPARDSFFNELIVWRELAVNFVKHSPVYDSIECAEPWAARSLAEHASDAREWTYSLEQLDHAKTHDELWNAAQLQMVHFGWMHNHMRMYWAKKILEWSPDPAIAFQHAVVLNDRYEIDGRDPNGYAGIAWAIAGKFDRSWFDRPIFGKVRYMSAASTGKKFNSKQYIDLVRTHAASGELW